MKNIELLTSKNYEVYKNLLTYERLWKLWSHHHSTKTHSFEKRIINDNFNFIVESASYIFERQILGDMSINQYNTKTMSNINIKIEVQ